MKTWAHEWQWVIAAELRGQYHCSCCAHICSMQIPLIHIHHSKQTELITHSAQEMKIKWSDRWLKQRHWTAFVSTNECVTLVPQSICEYGMQHTHTSHTFYIDVIKDWISFCLSWPNGHRWLLLMPQTNSIEREKLNDTENHPVTHHPSVSRSRFQSIGNWDDERNKICAKEKPAAPYKHSNCDKNKEK